MAALVVTVKSPSSPFRFQCLFCLTLYIRTTICTVHKIHLLPSSLARHPRSFQLRRSRLWLCSATLCNTASIFSISHLTLDSSSKAVFTHTLHIQNQCKIFRSTASLIVFSHQLCASLPLSCIYPTWSSTSIWLRYITLEFDRCICFTHRHSPWLTAIHPESPTLTATHHHSPLTNIRSLWC